FEFEWVRISSFSDLAPSSIQRQDPKYACTQYSIAVGLSFWLSYVEAPPIMSRFISSEDNCIGVKVRASPEFL
ncbi:MAG: hypothetical protein GVX96_01195, partial [Bacteroidetes bacterium]|nr:hypothetical protein [Bacteroidota bacterium]